MIISNPLLYTQLVEELEQKNEAEVMTPSGPADDKSGGRTRMNKNVSICLDTETKKLLQRLITS